MPAKSVNIAPVDESVVVPESVRRAAEAANAAHAAVYGATEHPVSEPQVTPAPEQQVSPAAEPQVTPAPEQQVTPATVSEPNWEHRYLSMKGRYDQAFQTIGGLQEQVQEIGNELLRTQQLLPNARQRVQPQNQPTQLLTPQDRETYGDDLIDVVKRAAVEAVLPKLTELDQRTNQTNQHVRQEKQASLYEALSSQLPNWNEINTSDRFLAWLRLRDVYSGEVRHKMLREAFQAANAPRVLAFFKGFLAEEAATGNVSVPQQQPQPQAAPRQAAVDIGTLTAPGRARPATGDTQVPVDKPIYTRSQIAGFYTQVRQGAFAGRDAEKARIEADIFAAQREGRVR
jgi:hypothetical protein